MKPIFLFFPILLLCQCSNPNEHKSDEACNQEAAINETIVAQQTATISPEKESSHCNERAVESESSHNAFLIRKVKNLRKIRIECDTIYEGRFPFLDNIRIYKNNRLLYSAPKDLYNVGEDFLLISYGDRTGYILLGKEGAVDNNTLLVVQYFADSDNTYATDLSGELIGDLDNDGYIEIIGWGLVEAVCNNNDCDSCYYNPIVVYQLDEQCHLDTALTKELNLARFGCYLGTEPTYDTICNCSRKVTYCGTSLW